MLRSTPPAAMVRPGASWLSVTNSTPSYSRTVNAMAAYGGEVYEPLGGEEGRSQTAAPPVQDNGSWNNASDYDDLYSIPSDLWMRYSPSIVAIFCLAYTVVFIIGLLGNSFVVAVVARSPRMRTVTNYFIVNLAMADILVVVFCIPATLVGNIFVPWMLGWFMCKTVSYLQGVAVSASINTLVAISMDRCLAICYPLKCQLSTRSVRKILLVIWTFSVAITFPWALYFTLQPIHPSIPGVTLCVEQWPDERSSTLYFILAHLVLCYIFPLLLIVVCYGCIWVKVWRRNIPGESKQTDVMVQKSKLKVVKMMLVVVVIFVLSWLPLYIIFTRLKLGSAPEEGSVDWNLMVILTPVAQWLGASNSCINPVLYAYFNRKFRRGFVAIIKSRSCCGTLREPSSLRGTTIRSAAGGAGAATHRGLSRSEIPECVEHPRASAKKDTLLTNGRTDAEEKHAKVSLVA
ncbi:neuropeptide SIFamide receptor-like [Dermacentor albipictus]|uniref:neuropeptide SIFamide receptor-like n=1 Tax=Dermacentor albipictus TaxID=60249 RepID=UPI0031FDD465